MPRTLALPHGDNGSQEYYGKAGTPQLIKNRGQDVWWGTNEHGGFVAIYGKDPYKAAEKLGKTLGLRLKLKEA